MKSYLSLIPISAKVHKRQSRMTRICIVLAVFLVTAIFSLAEMWTDGEITAMRSNHGDWHIVLQNMPEAKVEQIIDNSEVAYSSWHDEINTDIDCNYCTKSLARRLVLSTWFYYFFQRNQFSSK